MKLAAIPPINNPALDKNLQGKGGEAVLGGFIGGLITIILIAGTIVSLFMLLLGGIQWITSGGDKAKVEEARNKITHAIIGLILLFAAWAIILLISQFLGINLLGGPISLPTIGQ